MSTSTPFVSAILRSPAEDPLQFLVKFEDFVDGAGPGCLADAAYWTEINFNNSLYSPNTPVTKYTTPPPGLPAPFNTGCCVDYYLKNNEPTDTEPFKILKSGSDINEIFLRWYEYYTPGFIWPAGQKIARLFYSEGGGPVVQFQYGNTANEDQVLIAFGTYNGDPLFGDTQFLINPQVGGPPSGVPLGSWVKWEIYARASSAPNIADGRCSVLINDVIQADQNNIVTKSGAVNWNGFWIGGNASYNGNGPGGHTDVPQDQHRYISPIQIFSELPSDVVLP